MVELPDFDRWFRAVNPGQSPLPWQSRLAARVTSSRWPTEVGVPTGLGKTACLDIAVWAMAAEAGLAPTDRKHPRRIWYVVNRRLLVDAAFARAERLARLLQDPEEPDPSAIAAVADRLRALAFLEGTRPLHVSRLRGGAELGQRPPDPAHPSVILTTVPMFGSRWLFRGYGTSVGMRPVDAALAGCDSLVLLDEAHLARPLRLLVEPAAACDPGADHRLLPPDRASVRFVGLTATGDDAGDRFELDADDLAHEVVACRLNAAKAIHLVPVTTVKQVAASTAAEVGSWLASGPVARACLVFVNRPATARQVHGLVSAACARTGFDADLVLLTGRMREHEADTTRRRVLDPVEGAPASRDPAAPRSRPLVIVSTQTLEVGADLDVDHLITESAGARALTQRFGRLNRLGKRPWASGAIVHPADGDGGLYGAETADVWARLQASADADGVVGLSPAVIADRVGVPADQLPAPPELLPGLLWEWVKTTVAPTGESPVELFVEGRDEQRRRLQVCWRAVLDPYLPELGEGGTAPQLVPTVTSDETVELPVHELVGVLESEDLEQVARLASDRATLELVDVARLRSGDTVVLDASGGMHDEFGWNPQSRQPVLDVSVLAAGLLPLHRSAIENLLAPSLERTEILKCVKVLTRPKDDPVNGDLEDGATVAGLLARLRLAEPTTQIASEAWAQYVTGLSKVISTPSGGVAYLGRRPRPRRPGTAPVRADAFEELSFECEVTSPELAEHLATVGTFARRIAQSLGLTADVVEACRLAGSFHDLGKHDLRFQRWLSPDTAPPAPLAKSRTTLAEVQRTRVAAGWPTGGRHEVLSLRLVRQRYADDPPEGVDIDLVLHLVVSHHGHGRPSLSPCMDSCAATCTALVDGSIVTVAADLSVLDWDQPARFRRLCERYGYWGVALLETIVRQADHAASSAVAL